MLRRVKLVIPTLLLLCVAMGGVAPRKQGAEMGRQGLQGMTDRRAIVAAFVLPQLSFECVIAVTGAINTCISPGVGGAVACGMALVQILRVCP